MATAEGFVGDDEPTWGKRQEYAKRAMAQTRAISRACRSAFAHVVVMMSAGLETTPAEEVPQEGFRESAPTTAQEAPVPASGYMKIDGCITQPQAKRLWAIAKDAGTSEDELRKHLLEEYQIEHFNQIKRTDYEAICKWAEDYGRSQELPT